MSHRKLGVFPTGCIVAMVACDDHSLFPVIRNLCNIFILGPYDKDEMTSYPTTSTQIHPLGHPP